MAEGQQAIVAAEQAQDQQQAQQQAQPEANGGKPADQQPAQQAQTDEGPEKNPNLIKHLRKVANSQSKELAALRAEVAAMRQPAQPKPSREQYGTDAEFFDALTDYKVGQAMRQQPTVSGVDDYNAKLQKAAANHDDFQEALDSISHISTFDSGVLARTIGRQQFGDEVLYRIAKDPELAEEIAALPPAEQAAYITHLHQQIRTEKRSSAAKPVPAVSAAKPPIKPVQPRAIVDKDWDQMSMAEFRAARREMSGSKRKQ